MGRSEGSPNRTFPAHTLEESLVIVQAIADKGAGRSMDRLLVADAIGRTPSSSEFKRLLSSSLKYGLTAGSEKADNIVPTEIGLRIASPQNEQERGQGLIQACLKPELFARILNHYNRSKLPDAAFLKNALQKSFAVDASLAEECATVLVANAKFCGLIQDISGSKYVRIVEGTVPSNGDSPTADLDPGIDRRGLDVNTPAPPAPATPASPAPENSNQPRKIFVAHGKNRKPLDALKKVLDQFKIPYVVAVDEPHKGRPISAKVAQLMGECSAGIFIFTKDEKFLKEVDGDGPTEVYRPSENVVYELGAASVMWDRKIIILREDGVNFPSDFSDLGYITFHGDEVGSKALDLLRELVALGLVRVQAA
jgi:predicted nucleotide-binding protein